MLEINAKSPREVEARLLMDPKFYLENFTKIKGKTPGSLIPFILNEAQKDFFNHLRRSKRAVILKARQLGFSTAMVGYLYHKTITTPGTTTAIIGYNSDLTSELLDKVKTFYRTTPVELQPTIQYNSKFEISFPAIESKILVLPSTENVGRGYTLSNALCTELASWEKAEEKMMTLEASVPIDGTIVIESTPKGQGNLFHRMWMADDNGYTKKEYGWWWGYSKEEIDMIKKRMNDPMKFAQEYGLEFLASGRSVFEPAIIHSARKTVWKVGHAYTNSDGTTSFVTEENGWRIYKKPEPNAQYIMSADVAEGVQGGDYSVAMIFDRKTGEEVAMLRAFLPPDAFSEKLNKMGRHYNNALAVIEVNNHGLTVTTLLKNMLYPSLYFRPTAIDTLSGASSDKIGWRTTKVTRPLMMDDLGQGLREGSLILHSKELVDEMSVFIYNDKGDMQPQFGHDDCIFAAAIAFQGFKVTFNGKLEQIQYEDYWPVGFSY